MLKRDDEKYKLEIDKLNITNNTLNKKYNDTISLIDTKNMEVKVLNEKIEELDKLKKIINRKNETIKLLKIKNID